MHTTVQLMHVKRERESIHSGQFMVSHFEAEDQDDEDEVAVVIPDEVVDVTTTIIVPIERYCEGVINADCQYSQTPPQVGIDTSLAKLFQCMSLAYRQKLTSPKWNRFRGIKLRWKDKIRLNNVIWRCWHLQFIRKENTLICQFASPLDVDTHNKPEAVVLEGKYWKRKLAAVTAEYKKWRMFYRNHALGQPIKYDVEMLNDVDLLTFGDTQCTENVHMMVDEDYMGLMSDTLFSTISNQPFVFPDTRELARAGLADLIQPSLGPLQPNLEDYMDTFEPLHEFMASKLPSVPEEQSHDNILFKHDNNSWPYLDLMMPSATLPVSTIQSNANQISYSPQVQQQQSSIIQQLSPIVVKTIDGRETANRQQQQQHVVYQSNDCVVLPSRQNTTNTQYVQQQQPPPPPPPPSYHSSVISTNTKSLKNVTTSVHKHTNSQNRMQLTVYNNNNNNKSGNNVYRNYSPQQQQQQQSLNDPLQQQLPIPDQQPSILSSNQKFKQESRELSTAATTTTTGYKFSAPVIPNLKFSSSQQPQQQQISVHNMMQIQPTIHAAAHSQYQHIVNSVVKEDIKPEPKLRGAPRGRQRSRSNTREPIKRPPLISAVSDPSLITPSTSVLLTQLLTSNTSGESLSPLFSARNASMQMPSTNQIRIKDENNSLIPILPQPSSVPVIPTTTLIAITPLNINTSSIQQTSLSSSSSKTKLASATSDPQLLNSFSNSNSPVGGVPDLLSSPTSSSHEGSSESINQSEIQSTSLSNNKDQTKRVGHIHAEQKRRYNIKTGFDMIHSLIPHLTQNPNAKLSKAAMLQKGADYIRQLRTERGQLQEEMDRLRQQIDTLNTSISNCQSMLPATGAPVSRRRGSKMQEMFDEYVRNRTMENWKFWIFSLLFKPLLTSFNNFVSTSCLEDLYRSTMHWIEQHCTLVDLRPIVLNSLRHLSGKTDILAEPEKLQEEIHQLVMSTERK